MNDLMQIPIGMDLPTIAEHFCRSGLFRDAKSVSAALTKILAGRSIGLDPFASMSGLHVMQGKVEAGAHIIAGAIKASGRYDYRVVERTDQVCRLTFYERDRTGAMVPVGEERFDIAQAAKAGLMRNPTWTAYPRAMLFARAVSAGYRVYCPDVLRAPVFTEGELEPDPDVVRAIRAIPGPAIPAIGDSIDTVINAETRDLDPHSRISPVDLHLRVKSTLSVMSAGDRRKAESALCRAGGDPAKLAELLEWCERRRPVDTTRPQAGGAMAAIGFTEPEPDPEPDPDDSAVDPHLEDVERQYRGGGELDFAALNRGRVPDPSPDAAADGLRRAEQAADIIEAIEVGKISPSMVGRALAAAGLYDAARRTPAGELLCEDLLGMPAEHLADIHRRVKAKETTTDA